MDKTVDDQADSSSTRSRGSSHSAASGEHKGLPMPRLQSFSSGQVFNCSAGMQILVIPSKDDHVLEVNITWQLSVNARKTDPIRNWIRKHFKGLWPDSSLLYHSNSKETYGARHVLAMEAPDNCINLNVQWSLCQLVYIATLVCFV